MPGEDYHRIVPTASGLGAPVARVQGLLLRQAAVLVGVGLAVGVAASYGAAGLLESFVFGIEPRDTGTFVAAAVGLGLVALLASYLPARRASRIDPMRTLRNE